MSLSNGAPRIHSLGQSLEDARPCTVGMAKQISNANTNALAQHFTTVLQQNLPPIMNAHRALVDFNNQLLHRIEALEARTLRGRWLRLRLWVMNHATRIIARRHHAECVFLVGGPFNGRLMIAARLRPRSPTSAQHSVNVAGAAAAIYQVVDNKDAAGRRCFVFVGHESPELVDPTLAPPTGTPA